MLSKSLAACVCVASAALLTAPTIAQELKAEREENVTYYRVEMIKFHHGKRPRGAEIVDQYFAPADRDVGGQVIDLHLMTGDWDFVVMFPMAGGPADLTWVTSPDEVKWMNALGKRAGGANAAKKLLAEWDTLVAKREWHVGHTHNAPK